jgi:hypothetical protein
MRRGNLLLFGLIALWIASVLPLWDSGAPHFDTSTPRGRKLASLFQLLGRLPAQARIGLPGAYAELLPRQPAREESVDDTREISAKELAAYLTPTHVSRLSDEDVADLEELVKAAVQAAGAPEGFRERARAAAQALFGAVWGRVDQTVNELFQSAPDVN